MTRLTFPERARMARIRAGYPNEAAAAADIGCSRPLVISWEKGEAKSIGSKYLLDAAKAYKVRPEWLLMETEDDGYPWVPGSAGDSQAAGRNRSKLVEAMEFVQWAREVRARVGGAPFSATKEAELLETVYDWLMQPEEVNTYEISAWLNKEATGGESVGQNQDRSTQEDGVRRAG